MTAPHEGDAIADTMERRLLAWGAWRVAGNSGEGYPTRSVLHPSWSPPAQGLRPGMRIAARCDAEERQLDGIIGSLSVRKRDALFLVYCKRMTLHAAAEVLHCSGPDAVRLRIMQAKRELHCAMCMPVLRINERR
ncbi:MAG: hypothetical protein MUF08_03185 [Burkholderiaceae bacterium]|jgi:hypothetical protein|nr:hypothetical protein [Burkholderiaceae bacterium]MCU0964067.1 hypothetical protein [Burkholderiaceae bacterium]